MAPIADYSLATASYSSGALIAYLLAILIAASLSLLGLVLCACCDDTDYSQCNNCHLHDKEYCEECALPPPPPDDYDRPGRDYYRQRRSRSRSRIRQSRDGRYDRRGHRRPERRRRWQRSFWTRIGRDRGRSRRRSPYRRDQRDDYRRRPAERTPRPRSPPVVRSPPTFLPDSRDIKRIGVGPDGKAGDLKLQSLSEGKKPQHFGPLKTIQGVNTTVFDKKRGSKDMDSQGYYVLSPFAPFPKARPAAPDSEPKVFVDAAAAAQYKTLLGAKSDVFDAMAKCPKKA